jgi:hypothetical protein
MKGWSVFITSLGIVALFSLALLNFSFIFQLDNKVNSTILEDDSLSSFNQSIYEDLRILRNETTGFKNASDFEQRELEQPQGDLTLGSIFTSIARFSKFTLSSLGNIFNLAFKNLGIGAFFLNILLGLIIIAIVFLGWKLYKQGE